MSLSSPMQRDTTHLGEPICTSARARKLTHTSMRMSIRAKVHVPQRMRDEQGRGQCSAGPERGAHAPTDDGWQQALASCGLQLSATRCKRRAAFCTSPPVSPRVHAGTTASAGRERSAAYAISASTCMYSMAAHKARGVDAVLIDSALPRSWTCFSLSAATRGHSEDKDLGSRVNTRLGARTVARSGA